MEKIRSIPELERKAYAAERSANFAKITSLIIFGGGIVLDGIKAMDEGVDLSDFGHTGVAGGITAGVIYGYYRIKERRLRRDIKKMEAFQEQETVIEGQAVDITSEQLPPESN